MVKLLPDWQKSAVLSVPMGEKIKASAERLAHSRALSHHNGKQSHHLSEGYRICDARITKDTLATNVSWVFYKSPYAAWIVSASMQVLLT